MRQIDDPCYKCRKRKVGCHSRCRDYKEWKDERKEESDNIRKEKVIDSIIRAHISDAIERGKKHRHR